MRTLFLMFRKGALSALAIVGLAASLTAQAGEHVFYERKLTAITGGYDANVNQTIVRALYLRAVGPDDIHTEAESFVKHCAEESLKVAVGVAYSTPGELGVKFIAGAKAWNVQFPRCMSAREFARQYIDKFTFELAEKQETRDGLEIVVQVDKTPLELRKQAYDWFIDQTDATWIRPITDAETEWHKAMSPDIDIKPPREVGEGIKKLANLGSDADQARLRVQEAFEDVLRRANVDAQHAIDEQRRRIQEEAERQLRARQAEFERTAAEAVRQAQGELGRQAEQRRREAEAAARASEAHARWVVEEARRAADAQARWVQQQAEAAAEAARRVDEERRKAEEKAKKKAREVGEWIGDRTGIRF